jgi:hypothetical protein
MYDNATKDKFIELRAAGWSYTRIAEELNIDRKTVFRWNQQFGARMENLRQLQLEDLQQRLMGSQQQRFSDLVEEYQRYRNALKARNPDRIPQHTLFHITSRLRDRIEKQMIAPKFVPDPTEPNDSAEVQQ